MIKINVILIIILSFLVNSDLLAQGIPYEGPEDPAGDVAATREAFMDGNNTRLFFKNNTKLSDWHSGCGSYYSRWPNNINGTKMIDAIALLIGATIYVEGDSIPLDSWEKIIDNPDVESLFYLQTYYSGRIDTNPEGTVEYAMQPVFGYFSETSEHPAMSNRPDSWPLGGWPSRGFEKKWQGEWNGRFGRGVQYADLETYFVANDAQDQEYLEDTDPIKYYPRPGKKIGDIRPDVTTQYGFPWGGLGVRVEVRGFQWNNPQTRDVIFFEYGISNISDYNILNTAFGYWVNTGIGDDGYGDDIAYYNTELDLSYNWDIDGVGRGGVRTGIWGFAFLESASISWDGKDNDEDGLIDEKRDNQVTNKIGPYDGISNLQQFLDFYGLSEDQLKEHWDADEDQDWRDGDDANGNGVYDKGEDAGDDVGLDGVGPQELNYYGPDEDGTECNHKPDLLVGVGAEPNFGLTDISESDMLGLTSFHTFINPSTGAVEGNLRGDRSMYEMMDSGELMEFNNEIGNWISVFASSSFPLYKGRTERISMANLYSYDGLAGLQSSDHSAPALFEKKRIVQYIYESDYRFAQPPKMPILTATPGDGKVILTWNDVADKFTREPLLGGENDFEGYKLYKATDSRFADAEKLFDGYGNPIGKKPIFQCDLKNGVKGFTDFAPINGELFYLGDDSGIQHYFVDENVENGRTYYYALVAYDRGIQGLDIAIAPAENNIVLDLDESEEIRHVGQNVQVVTPYQPAAGYVPPSIDMKDEEGLMGTGYATPIILSASKVKSNHTYKIKFNVDTLDHSVLLPYYRHKFDILYTNNGYSVYDVTSENSLVYEETPDHTFLDNIIIGEVENTFWHLNPNKEFTSDIFDGIQLKIRAPVITAVFDSIHSGWVVGDAPLNITLSVEESHYFPWQYDIVFTSNDTVYQGQVNTQLNIKDIDGSPLENMIMNPVFNFYVINKSFSDLNGNYEKLEMIVADVNNNGTYEMSIDHILVGHMKEYMTLKTWSGTVFAIDFHDVVDSTYLPKPNDAYHVDFIRPFVETDSILFTILPDTAIVEKNLANTMDDIKVVPNPYIATNSMEPYLFSTSLNQRRRLMFTHIPAQCTIKIFTTSGIMVDEIKVQNPPPMGIVHWDMLTYEGLEIAPGIYFYHVKTENTGDEKLGKFAVIK